jgi:signal transduction histidine kinase
MAGFRPGESGTSHGEGKGFPQLLRIADAHRLRRTALAAVAVGGFLAATVATTAAIEGHADAGVVIDSSGRVERVSATGFAWRDGVRPGQEVISSSPADAEDGYGWRLVVRGDKGPITSREAPVLEALRGSLPFALVGLGAGCLAIGFLRLNRNWALPSASLALAGASLPLFLANQPVTPSVLALSALVPSMALAWRLRRSRGVAIVAAVTTIALVALWLRTYLDGLAVDPLEQTRRVLALGGTGILMADRAVQRRPTRLGPLKALSVASAVALVATGLALVYFAGFPAPIIAIAIVLVLLAFQPVRQVLGRRLELALLSDLRQHVAADVAEEERGRLARELHDVPLQELAAVIRRLELVPQAEDETSSLRAIADQLRTVAIDLRPPMLDDLGLGAALDFLAEQVTTPGTHVTPSFQDTTGLDRESRPPAAVEFALYRIAREAVGNALRHARATHISIAGQIASTAIDLTISDDGIGLPSNALRRASGRGRLGLSSMRRRAQAIGADLSIEGDALGTHVAVTWRA